MPELPEVEGVVNSLKPVAIGKTIEHVEISSVLQVSRQAGKQAIIKGSELEPFKQKLANAKITQIVRRSKYIYFHLLKDQQELLLVTHLGMTGAWFYVQDTAEIAEDKFRKHIHVIWKLDDGMLLVYADIRRFGEMRLMTSEDQFPPLLLMAPEPFHESALNHFIEMSKLTKYQNKSIKETIMDGQVISGCGNIYATEALYRMRIHPGRKVKRISQKRLIPLFQMIVDVLNESISAGGSSISDYRNINGEAGGMQDRLQMYGKKQCPACLIPTKQVVLGGRNSWYCPSCQR
ncbi:bifunctional DNA-formamidopyrimidine glycosylase/DNA-(apurinic or apyrimidinic site) lyase [Paenisporosarcina quisquiliarum]|uniref:Bifunctional DNA-formamidopyrimidine glycosylase/DNA-(Apurinic or apyrimidinic site) lyase n=1 Tax=Paenisporosarcina quisquiliarum TaxID=365346 RepID=A0A9X3LDX1_9BACL|nr:bifunctional DNA-formamidopyrimidine glycosylase/DNA-(apurinic or apyrimidinic site) lyase [Paenisporosarcina quisquiliarum]MCZ8536258.1 bifunctional DNA-formamidopyrimidine glycosylase/DNA-(apurinic or apyrimidinic site) lyase [Paenisporosarcina quisquiliarum]